MMVFRNGGKVPKNVEIILDNRKIKIVTEFKYLGITLQSNGKCFTKHVTGRAANAIMAINDIKNIQALSLDTAMKLFRAKILPTLSYGIEIIWPHLTVANLEIMERVKALYLKRALRLSKTTRSQLE